MTDRAMTVEVTIGGVQNADHSIGGSALTYAFALSSTAPVVTPTGPIVDSHGNIDLPKFPSVSGYTNNVDITYRICGSVRGLNGQSYPVRWATATESSGPTPADSVGYGWFTESENVGAPVITITGMSFSRTDDQNIVLQDDLDNNSPYYYSLGFVIPNINGPGSAYYITIDPRIVTPPA